MNNPKSPDKVTTSTLCDIMRSSQTILDTIGVNSSQGSREGICRTIANIGINETRLTQLPEDKLPILTISRAVGSFARNARWSYEITYAMHDSNASKRILILNGEVPGAEMSFYNTQDDRQLTETEGQILAEDLARLISNGL